MSRSRRRRLVLVVLTLVTAVSLVSFAQTQTKRSAKPARGAPARRSASDAADAAGSGVSRESSEAVLAKDAGTLKGGVVEQKTLDGGARVFRFGEVEVEGRLKSPQIVYFLRRVRAEFAAKDLGHRSFMRELGETKNEPSF